MGNKIAIIDLGTNTFHLLIAETNGPVQRTLLRERIPVKIGMGGINEGMITPAGEERAIAALSTFNQMIENFGVQRVLAFGTSAMRNARNGKEVIDRIRKKTGIECRLISGDEEAGYIYKGVRQAVSLGMAPSLIVDIGGGSVEFIIGNQESIFWKQSFEVGAQRMLEKFQKHDPIHDDERMQLSDFLSQALAPLFEELVRFNPRTLVGSSGTFDTLSDIHCIRHHIAQTDHPETPLTEASFHEIFKAFLSKDRTARLRIPGMIEMRVDMIVVACCLIQLLLTRHHFDSIRVSTYSLKEGVLSDIN